MLDISKHRLTIDASERVKDLVERACRFRDINSMRLLDGEGVAYSNDTPMAYVLDREFTVATNDKQYTSVLNFISPEEGLVNLDESLPLKDVLRYKTCRAMGLNDRETQVIGKFVSRLLDNMEDGETTVSSDKLHLLLENHILDNALMNKRQVVK